LNRKILNKKYKCWLHYDDKNKLEITEKPIHVPDEMNIHLGDEVIVVTKYNMELKKIPVVEIKGWNDHSIWGNLPNGISMTYLLGDIIYLMNA